MNTNKWIAWGLLPLWIVLSLLSFVLMLPENGLGWALVCFYICLPILALASELVLKGADWKARVCLALLWGLAGYGLFALVAGDFDEPVFFFLGLLPAAIGTILKLKTGPIQ